MKKSLPLISVIIPLCNRHDIFRNTLASVLKQSYANFEVIVVDNGSDSSPLSLLKEFNDDRIAFYQLQEKNANAARNFGILHCSGDYVAMLDADDEWVENHLENCMDTLMRAGADGLYGSLIMKRYPDIDQGIFYVRELQENESVADYLLTTGYGAQTSSLFVTTQSALDILWDEKFINHQDYDFVIRFYKKYKMVPKKNPTTIYYLFDGSLSHTLDHKSFVRFSEKYREEINPLIYFNYNLNMYRNSLYRSPINPITDYFMSETIQSLTEETEQFLIDELHRIKDLLMKKENLPNSPGLMDGKMGVALFLFHYADYSKEEICEDYAFDIIMEIQKQLHNYMPVNYSSGLTGIGTAIKYLIEQKFLYAETNDILYDFDGIFENQLRDRVLYLSFGDVNDLKKYYQFNGSIINPEQRKMIERIEYILELHEKIYSSASDQSLLTISLKPFYPQTIAFKGLEILSLLDKQHFAWLKLL